MRHALTLDIGGSHVTAAVVDLNSRTLLEGSETRVHVDEQGSAEALLGAWANASREALENASVAGVHHVGIAMPDPFEYDTGVSRMQHKFAALYGVNVGDGLRKRLGVESPVLFGNDATLYALGEWWVGEARGFGRVIGVTIGTGLGAGFIAQGQPCYGSDGSPPNGVLWNQPYQGGIAEDHVSGPALRRAYTRRSGSERSALEIAQAADAGDEQARLAFAELGDHLGVVLEPWVRQFRAEAVVVGGNVARAWPWFQRALEDRLQGTGVLVRQSQLFDRANLMGAAALG